MISKIFEIEKTVKKKHLDELKILDTLKKSPHYIFDSVLFSNTKNEKVCININDPSAVGYVYPRINFDWILFNEATKRTEKNEGYVIQNFRVKNIFNPSKSKQKIVVTTYKYKNRVKNVQNT